MPGKKVGGRSTQLAKIRKALASDEPLVNVRETIAETNRQQQVVVWVFAAILETNSAALTALVERFTAEETAEIEASLREIGATRTADDLASLRHAFDDALAAGSDDLDASDAVHDSPLGKEVRKRRDGHVREMEERLLAYCEAHVEALAAT